MRNKVKKIMLVLSALCDIKSLHKNRQISQQLIQRKNDKALNKNRQISQKQNLVSPYADPIIPHICHGRTDDVRVNFFGWCKFLQIQKKVAFFYRFNAKNWRFSV